MVARLRAMSAGSSVCVASAAVAVVCRCRGKELAQLAPERRLAGDDVTWYWGVAVVAVVVMLLCVAVVVVVVLLLGVVVLLGVGRVRAKSFPATPLLRLLHVAATDCAGGRLRGR